MAVPKKRTGKSAQATRRANWKATKPEVNVCPNCGAFVLAHTDCTACGFYKGKPVSLKNAQAAEEVKKPAKKAAKKQEVVEEKVENKVEAAVEEVKEEKKPTKKTTEKKAIAKKTTKSTSSTAKKTKKTEE